MLVALAVMKLMWGDHEKFYLRLHQGSNVGFCSLKYDYLKSM